MNILGISSFYHDAAACLMRDGRVVLDGPPRTLFRDHIEELRRNHIRPPQVVEVAHSLSDHGLSAEIIQVNELVEALRGA